MHTAKVELTTQEAIILEDRLLEIANQTGKPLNFSILLMPNRALLTGYFKNKQQAMVQLEFIGLAARAQHGFLRDRDWQDSVKKHFKPLIYRGIAWVPSWEKKIPDFKTKNTKSKVKNKNKVKKIIRLDIGMAFGTGNHPTTRLCLRRLVETLEKYFAKKQKPTVLDIGCGSGILAITADKLGAAHAEGFDLDEHSIVVAKRNANLNHSKAKLYVADLYKKSLGTHDIVLANLLANLIADNAKKLWASVKPGGTLILSGLLKEELASTAKHFPASPKAKIKATKLGKWGVLMIKKL